MSCIEFWHRAHQRYETEKVYGSKWIETLYKTKAGQLAQPLVTHPQISALYGWMQNQNFSAAKVPTFIKNFEINLEDYLPGSLNHNAPERSYKNFNEFFTRAFKPGKRKFCSSSHELSAFAEARYLGVSAVTRETNFKIKGIQLPVAELVNSNGLKIDLNSFLEGPALIARLCPVDYHRYHYPDDGEVLSSYEIPGILDSVNPMALGYKPDIFLKNYRTVSHLKTKNFGELLYVEVGATCVGKIVQTHDARLFKRGDQKGYFLFGGSTVVVLGQKNAWLPSSDILLQTLQGKETYIQLGDVVAKK